MSQEEAIIFNREKKAGKKAAKMTQQFLHAVIRQKVTIRNVGIPDQPILKATKIRSKMGEYRLLGLNLTSSKTAFILNFGFTGVREATAVYYQASRFNVDKSQRERHPVKLPERDFFSLIYEFSGAIDYLVAELSQTRKAAIQIKLNKLIITFNNQNGKK